MSNQNGAISTKESSLIVNKTNVLLNINTHTLTIIVRKGAHVLEYLVLFILIFINLKEFKIKNTYRLSIILSLIYSIFDEFHQLFVKERSGSIYDCLIDLIGILIGYLIMKLLNKKENN